MTPPAAAAAPAVDPRPPLAPHRPFTTAPRPRRVSGPVRRPLVERPARWRSPEYAGIALGLSEALSRLSEHRLLDRLIRGRTWIALVAFALIGIVTLQLGLLRLNAGIGHALQKEASLQRENAALSIENSELAAGDLVESSASRLGMEVVPAGALRFLTARPAADARRAAAALSVPVGSSSTPAGTGEGSFGSAAASGTGEGSSASAAASSGPSASAEGSAQSSGSQPSTSSSGSEAEVSKTPSSEASTPAPSPRTGPSPTESSAEQSTPGSGTAAAPATGAGSTEPSGGTQAGSTGR
jgi:hypothetical protein